MFKGWYIVTAIFTFILIFFIGFLSGVTWTISLMRAGEAAVVLGGAAFFFLGYLEKLLTPSDEIAAASGSVIDVTVPQEDLQQIILTETEPASKQEAQPFVPRQIDPKLQDLIKEDPLRAAQILEKMGLDL